MSSPARAGAPQHTHSTVDVFNPVWLSKYPPQALPPTDSYSLGQRKVLQACVQLFADEGFAASSIRDIGSVAGMQSASLYSHFPSKDAMLTALVSLGYDYHLDRVVKALINAPSDPCEQLRTLVHQHVLVHCEYPRISLVVNRETKRLQPEARERAQAARVRSANLVHDILERGEEQGVFSIGGRAATLFAIASMGVDAARWFPWQDAISAEDLAADYVDLALRMVGVAG